MSTVAIRFDFPARGKENEDAEEAPQGVAETEIHNEWVNYLANEPEDESTSLSEQSSCNQGENRCPTIKLTMFVMFATFGFIQHWTVEHVVDEAQIKHTQWGVARKGGDTGNCRKCARGGLAAKHLNKTFNLLPLSIYSVQLWHLINEVCHRMLW